MQFGDQKAMLDRIYGLAASIPGGMLKVQGRNPVKFVMDMLEVLRSPGLLHQEAVSLDNSRRGFHSAITDENRVQAVEKLTSIGRQDLATRFGKSKEEGGEGSVKLDIDKDFIALDALLHNFSFQQGDWGMARGISVWKMFQSYGSGGHGMEGPAEPIPAQTLTAKPDVRLYRSKIDTRYTGGRDPEFVHVMTVDGRVEYVGRNGYEAEVALIKISADKHIQEGVFFIKAAFNAFANAQKAPMELPEQVSFRFHSPGGQYKWSRENFDATSKAVTGGVCEDFTASHEQLSSLSDTHRDKLRMLVDGTRHGGCSIDVNIEEAIAQPSLMF
jgi:hypothetical protein